MGDMIGSVMIGCILVVLFSFCAGWRAALDLRERLLANPKVAVSLWCSESVSFNPFVVKLITLSKGKEVNPCLESTSYLESIGFASRYYWMTLSYRMSRKAEFELIRLKIYR